MSFLSKRGRDIPLLRAAIDRMPAGVAFTHLDLPDGYQNPVFTCYLAKHHVITRIFRGVYVRNTGPVYLRDPLQVMQVIAKSRGWTFQIIGSDIKDRINGTYATKSNFNFGVKGLSKNKSFTVGQWTFTLLAR